MIFETLITIKNNKNVALNHKKCLSFEFRSLNRSTNNEYIIWWIKLIFFDFDKFKFGKWILKFIKHYRKQKYHKLSSASV